MLPPVSTVRYSPTLRFGYKPLDDVRGEITEGIRSPILEVWYEENKEELTAFLNQRLFINYTRKDLLKDLYSLLNRAAVRSNNPTEFARLKDLRSCVESKTASQGFDWDLVKSAYRKMADMELISLGDSGLFIEKGFLGSANPFNWTRGYIATDQGRYVLRNLP